MEYTLSDALAGTARIMYVGSAADRLQQIKFHKLRPYHLHKKNGARLLGPLTNIFKVYRHLSFAREVILHNAEQIH